MATFMETSSRMHLFRDTAGPNGLTQMQAVGCTAGGAVAAGVLFYASTALGKYLESKECVKKEATETDGLVKKGC